MAWLSVNENGNENISMGKPFRGWGRMWEHEEEVCIESEWGTVSTIIEIPMGTIEKIIGKKLTWEDDPIEIKQSLQFRTNEPIRQRYQVCNLPSANEY